MEEKKKQLAEILKNKRLEQGLSIEEVSLKLLVKKKDLENLEQGKTLQKDNGYLRLLIRKYYQEIGGNFQDIKDLIDEIAPLENTIFLQKEDDLVYGKIEITNKNKNSLSKLGNFLLVAVLIIFLLGLIGFTVYNIRNYFIDNSQEKIEKKVQNTQQDNAEKNKQENKKSSSNTKKENQEKIPKDTYDFIKDKDGKYKLLVKNKNQFNMKIKAIDQELYVAFKKNNQIIAYQGILAGSSYTFNVDPTLVDQIYIKSTTGIVHQKFSMKFYINNQKLKEVKFNKGQTIDIKTNNGNYINTEEKNV